MLDYGYRSRCCKAPLALAKVKKNNIIKQVWKCTKCRKTNVDIIPNDELGSQEENDMNQPFSEIS